MRYKTIFISVCLVLALVVCNNTFATCKHWDTYTGISTSITVHDAVLCENTWHHVSTPGDQDRWHYDCSTYYHYPTDSPTYYWDKWAGSNPSSGTFTSSTDSCNVYWKAPCYTGTVYFSATVDDTPLSMDDPCPGSSTDDSSVYKSDTSTVSLPSGCSTGSKNADLELVKGSNPDCEELDCGDTDSPINIGSNIVAYYKNNECKWVFDVEATATSHSDTCSGNFIEISSGDDEDLNQYNWCPIVWDYVNDNGCCVYSTELCVEYHENCHFDLIEDELDPNQEWWLEDQSVMELEIDCSNSNTTTCVGAKNIRQSDIEACVAQAYQNATDYAEEQGEEPCIAAAKPCFEAMADAICNYAATQQGWGTCDYCPDL